MDRRAGARRARHVDLAGVHLDDLPADVEAQPVRFAGRLGRDPPLEYVRQQIRGNAPAGIGNVDVPSAPGRKSAAASSARG